MFKRTQLSPSPKNGFSLLELLVVIVIVGILASIALGSFDFKGQIAISNLENMRSWIEAARRSALRGQACTVTISNSNLKDGSTIFGASPANSSSCGSPSTLQLESPYGNQHYLLTIKSGSSDISSFSFTPRGSLFNSVTTPAFSSDLVFSLRTTNSAYQPTSKTYCLRMTSMIGSVQGIGLSSC
jgi:prepilin-type N-terminal cleavage/methylation domain-containing protein